jgi:hypothetical protein
MKKKSLKGLRRDIKNFQILLFLFPLFICAYNDWVITPPILCPFLFPPPPPSPFQAETVCPYLNFVEEKV